MGPSRTAANHDYSPLGLPGQHLGVPGRLLGDEGNGAGVNRLLAIMLLAGKLLLEEREYNALAKYR